MTEFEINKAVADKHLQCDFFCNDKDKLVYLVEISGGELLPWDCFDPCNNAQQAWEIMLANNISITKDRDNEFMAFIPNVFYDGTMECTKEDVPYSDKPFVAAMLLFLEI